MAHRTLYWNFIAKFMNNSRLGIKISIWAYWARPICLDESLKMPPRTILNNCQNNVRRQIHPTYRVVSLSGCARFSYKQPLL